MCLNGWMIWPWPFRSLVTLMTTFPEFTYINKFFSQNVSEKYLSYFRSQDLSIPYRSATLGMTVERRSKYFGSLIYYNEV